jgi:6-phosphogluconolactonase
MSGFAQNISRRALLGGAIAIGATPTCLVARPTRTLIAGNYAQEGGLGLVPLAAGPNGWTTGPARADIRNASFGVRAGITGIRYLTDEQEKGAVGVYAPDLRRLGTLSTLGAGPCHLALSPDGRTLAAANYSSGSVAVWKLDQRTGLPLGEAQRIDHSGSGPDRQRQAGPHAHWVGFFAGGQALHAIDLGADAIFAHALDPDTAKPGATSIAYRAPAGSGPRFLAHHPRLPIAYLVSELANTVTVLGAQPDGRFEARDIISPLPPGSTAESFAAHIVVNRAGTRLYVSNRGHDSIAVFEIGRYGALKLLQNVGSGGHWPRAFLLDEDGGEMLVANERSGNVARLALLADGRLGAARPGVTIPGVVFLSA